MEKNKIFIALLACGNAASLLATNTTNLNGHQFTLPAGFTIELAASSHLAPRPIVADFDSKGRLYVADSSGSNERVEAQLMDKPHRILRMEDTDGDGRFDKQTVFADKMMFPEGVLYHDGAVYIGAPPTIWKLEDKDDDGVAETRTEWFKQAVLTGCANDIHGPYLGPDGWLYWCKGGFGKLNLPVSGKKPLTDRAAHIFRARVDGSGLESFMAGGMDNPVEIAFTPEGEAIFTTTFYTNPEGGKRDGLVHAIYGGAYPKVHDVIDDLKQTGDLLPILTHLGPAAPSGLTRYASQSFGREFQNNLFSTAFNLRKVFRHTLTQQGGGFASEDSDFLVSDQVDFHPTDVLEDADGSLLVIDTGGWYKLCCPTSQLAKPDVLGGIYRIRKIGAPKMDDPWGLKLNLAAGSPAEIAKHLGDQRPMVRKETIFQLGKKGASAAGPLGKVLESNAAPETKRNAIWALTRIDSTEAREAVRKALMDDDATVQQSAARSVASWRDAKASEPLIALLDSKSPHVARTAAEGIGRLGNAAAVPSLLKVAAIPRDRMLEHSIIYALIEINDPAATRAGLEDLSPYSQCAALVALDQMDDSDLRPEDVSRWLASNNPIQRDTAMWVALRHPDWAASFAEFFRTRLYERSLGHTESLTLQKQLAAFGKEAAIQEILISVIARPETPMNNRLLALRAIAESSLREIPEPWIPEFQDLLKEKNIALHQQLIATIRALPFSKDKPSPFGTELLATAADEAIESRTRLLALDGAGPIPQLPASLFDFLISNLQPSIPPQDRSIAATALGRSRLSSEQLMKLADFFREAGPLEIAPLLNVFEAHASPEVGKLLVESLAQAKSFAAIRPEILRAKLAKFPQTVREEIEKLIAKAHQDQEAQKSKLESMHNSLPQGDIRRGQTIFNSASAACVSCHAIGYVGGVTGPDLTRVGAIRTEKDLLESIVFPSASLVRSYEPMLILTQDGETHNGIIRRESGDTIYLAAGAGLETQIPKSEITEMKPGFTSIMPEGLDAQLDPQQLSDLVAFLKSLK
ncbi:MAG: PVC-type heme-binding CxxCH protein [Verrucomicrobiales bacterium]